MKQLILSILLLGLTLSASAQTRVMVVQDKWGETWEFDVDDIVRVYFYEELEEDPGEEEPSVSYIDDETFYRVCENTGETVFSDFWSNIVMTESPGTSFDGSVVTVVGEARTNADGSTTQTSTTTDFNTNEVTTSTTVIRENIDDTINKTIESETKNADGVKIETQKTESTTNVETDEVWGIFLPQITAETVQTVTTTTYNEDGTVKDTDVETQRSVTSASYKYTYEVDGVTYETVQQMLAALSTKTTTATVLITLVETITTIGFDGRVTMSVRTSCQVSQIPASQGTKPITMIINFPTSIETNYNGISLASGSVPVVIVPKDPDDEGSGSGGGVRW